MFEIITGKVIDGVEKVSVDELSEINIFFEENTDQLSPMPALEAERADPKESLKFARTNSDQKAEMPDEAEFQGELDTVATSDSQAEAGEEKEVSLSGDQEMKENIITENSNFADGDRSGDGTEFEAVGVQGKGRDSNAQVEIKPSPISVMAEITEEASRKELFKDVEGVDRMIEDEKVSKVVTNGISEESKPMVDTTQNTSLAKPQVAKDEGGSNGAFKSKQTRTRIRGILNAQGQGSLNVENTELGRYEAKVFKEIEREWQARNFQFRSHLAPGLITLRFLLDEKGKVSGQRRIDMRGASDIQWGIVLNAVAAAKIPAMSKNVRKELSGESLELTVTFNY